MLAVTILNAALRIYPKDHPNSVALYGKQCVRRPPLNYDIGPWFIGLVWRAAPISFVTSYSKLGIPWTNFNPSLRIQNFSKSVCLANHHLNPYHTSVLLKYIDSLVINDPTNIQYMWSTLTSPRKANITFLIPNHTTNHISLLKKTPWFEHILLYISIKKYSGLDTLN